MATDPNGGSPWAHGDILTPASANILRANDLIQLDTAGGTRTMSAKLTLQGTGVLEVSDKYLVTSRSVVRQLPMVGNFDSSNASYTSATGGPRFTSTTTTASRVTVPISAVLHNGNVLTAIGFWFKAAAGGASHHSGALGVPPKVYMFSYRQDAAAETQLGATTTDAIATVPAYETRRLISVSLTGLPGGGHTIDKDKNTYYAHFEFEGGANAVAGAYINGLQITTTVTQISAGG